MFLTDLSEIATGQRSLRLIASSEVSDSRFQEQLVVTLAELTDVSPEFSTVANRASRSSTTAWDAIQE
jgi:hypothetical protein